MEQIETIGGASLAAVLAVGMIEVTKALVNKVGNGNGKRTDMMRADVIETKLDNLTQTCRDGFSRLEASLKELNSSIVGAIKTQGD